MPLVSRKSGKKNAVQHSANKRGSDRLEIKEGRREERRRTEETNVTGKRIPILELKAIQRMEMNYLRELQALEEFNRNINFMRQC